MQLVISIFLRMFLGFAAGFTLWADEVLASVKARLNSSKSLRHIWREHDDSIGAGSHKEAAHEGVLAQSCHS
jgi:hypothetical protein